MEAFANKTERLIKLSEEKIKKDVSVLEDCISSLEDYLKRLTKPQPIWRKGFRSQGGGFIEGASLGNCGAMVTQHIDGMGLLEYQERSAKVWVQAILHSCAHYHHLVGPAMIANAKIEEKLGNIDRVLLLCSAVFQDFQAPLERCESEDYALEDNDDEMESIKSLEYAVLKLLEHDPSNKYYTEIKKRINLLWKKPKYAK